MDRNALKGSDGEKKMKNANLALDHFSSQAQPIQLVVPMDQN
jgi:hypothetical protein